ncbi:MAG TPA: hypothetical protein VJI32_04900 [Candidatus Nanoarchaeia archaeon]|nr:hypothetical protein [Candidatus Nanoarchaeia archaeon]
MVDGKAIIAVIFFILGFVVYLFYRWLFAPGERKRVVTTSEKKPWYSPFFTNPLSRAKIKQIHQQHQHKHKEAEKEALLGEFGKKELVSRDFTELQKVIHEHHRTKWHGMTPPQQNEFKRLQKLIKQRENIMSVKERGEVMERLRKMRK